MQPSHSHSSYMKEALELASRGRYTVSPNPMVGCVIVKNEKIIGIGFHEKAGGPHAEIIALQQAGSAAKDAIAYVTLEPCCHYGRTPPCTDALIRAGIKKVYAACADPNPLVSGKGIQQLREANIEVETGLHESEAIQQNEIFFHFIRNNKPFVIAKWAMSLDGKTITHPEDSPKISSHVSHQAAHETRQLVDAILIGANTAREDNPELNVRYPADAMTHKQPLRIVLSSQDNLSLDLKVFDTSKNKTLVITSNNAKPSWINALREKQVEVIIAPQQENRIDLHFVLAELGKRNLTSLLVEGGMTVLQEFFQENLVQKIHVYLAPTIIGSLKQKQSVMNVNVENLHHDYFITADYGVNHV